MSHSVHNLLNLSELQNVKYLYSKIQFLKVCLELNTEFPGRCSPLNELVLFYELVLFRSCWISKINRRVNLEFLMRQSRTIHTKYKILTSKDWISTPEVINNISVSSVFLPHSQRVNYSAVIAKCVCVFRHRIPNIIFILRG